MGIALIFRFLVILLAMLVAGVCGYLLARQRANERNAEQLSMMSAEIVKMRRRAHAAEAKETEALSRLNRSRRRQRRA